MAKTLDFNKTQKRYLNVVLADGKNTRLLVGMPTKAIMRHFFAVQERLDEVEGTEVSGDLLDGLYEVCAMALSHNKAGVKVEQEKLETLFDFDDIMLFFNTYLDFIVEAANEKN